MDYEWILGIFLGFSEDFGGNFWVFGEFWDYLGI